ncbi:head-tail connector protein [Marinobacter sp.]|uniref:head-tail connector protein n=1 Tax=Marinobacter sp. TaxID=50741 RepID=UPI0019980AC9|nr:head-tail connector protein [Marinobacter sp.]MBC7193870.1 phage head-tail connector protein [Marinobacter sp.]
MSLQEAKAHLRVDIADDDGLIAALITAAREYCEAFQRRAYVTQAWEFTLDAWPNDNEIRLPRPPLQSVTAITYRDSAGTEYTMPTTDYLVDIKSEPGRIVLAYGKVWPSLTLYPAGAISIRYVAGYGDAAAVPQRVKQAMLLLIGHWYEHREGVITGTITKAIEFAVEALLWQDRVW